MRIMAQQASVPLNYEWIQESEARMVNAKGFDLSPRLLRYDADTLLRVLSLPDSVKAESESVYAWPLQTSMRPWIERGHVLRLNVIMQNANDRRYEKTGYYKKGWLRRYHVNQSLIEIDRKAQNGEPAFRLYINPMLNLQKYALQNDTSTENLYINTRGVTARGDIGSKISFETSFWENQAYFPAYIDSFALKYGVIPGQGRWKKFGTTGYDFASASGYISYTPARFLNIQAGNGKFFVGDGYRSLLLSDNSFNYPYARITTWFGPAQNIQYSVIYASLMNLSGGGVPVPTGTERLFQKKPAAFQQLAVKIARIAEISLFQGVIWHHTGPNNKQSFDFNYFNPVIFTSLPVKGLNDTRDNYLIGATFRVDLLRTLSVYGQYMLDSKGESKSPQAKNGLQAGVKYFNAFTLKHLHLQAELNKVSPFAYAHADSTQAYTHYNQPLAHPLGANFTEINASLQYKWNDIYLHARIVNATAGKDSSGTNYGHDIFRSDNSATIVSSSLPGVESKLTSLDLQLGYMISYASNLNIALGYTARTIVRNGVSSETSFIYFAFRTSLTNAYFDFF
ncbi:MAG: hypothetical protein Fur0041_18010 [Bacteroidia bacterium]